MNHSDSIEIQTKSLVCLRRILRLSVVMLSVLCLVAWEVHGIKKAVEAQEQEMPSVTITVTAVRGSNNETVTVPITTTQGEMPDNTDETRGEWIARTQSTAADWKAAIENS